MMEIHKEPSILSRKTVTIKKGVSHPQLGDMTGMEYEVEDWWDRDSGGSWMTANGNPACLIYAVRKAQNNLPMDNEVLYGKIGPFGHLVHISEIEGGKEVN